MSGVLWAVLGVLGGLGLAVIGDMLSEEVRDRLDHLPHALLRLAAHRLDPAKRGTVYVDEWMPELTYILRGSEARPVSRLYHGTRFAFGILAAARRIDRDLPPGWWQGYADILPHWVEPYFGLEAAASFIREYELQFVPGLLQIEEYARAVMRLGNLPSEDEVDRRTKARMSRQEILSRDNPPKLWAVLDESALRRVIGDRRVMRAQLLHLIDMCDHPAVTLQILPFSAGAHRALGGPFTILRYPEPDLRDVVYIEQLTSALYLDKPTEVDVYTELMEEVCLQADPSAKTKALLGRYLADI